MGPDLTDKRWIVAKGILFAVLAVFAGVIQLLTDFFRLAEASLLVICVLASCRLCYFFRCLLAYVDPGLMSAGDGSGWEAVEGEIRISSLSREVRSQ